MNSIARSSKRARFEAEFAQMDCEGRERVLAALREVVAMMLILEGGAGAAAPSAVVDAPAPAKPVMEWVWVEVPNAPVGK